MTSNVFTTKDVYYFKSKDGEVFPISEASLKKFGILSDSVKAFAPENFDNPIVLDNILSTTMKQLLQCTAHYENDPPMKTNDTNSSEKENRIHIPKWDQQFFNLPIEDFCRLIVAADHLEIEWLKELLVVQLDIMLEGKTVREMRDILDIPIELYNELAAMEVSKKKVRGRDEDVPSRVAEDRDGGRED